MNSVVMAWLVLFTGAIVLTHRRKLIRQSLPHVSVFAFLVINVLSIAFAQERSRAVNYAIKLILMFIGAYSLFALALQGTRSRHLVYRVIVGAVSLCLGACLVSRYYHNSESFGFFDSAFKYSSYMVIMGSLAVTYCLQGRRPWGRLFGCVLLIGMLVTVGLAGAIAAIVLALTVFMIMTRKKMVGGLILLSLFIAGTILFNFDKGITADLALAEADRVNLKQRYIEWQAEINLLEQRGITGTGAGGINTHRSSFYYRLPKLNTLQPFDQNGWLACAAEIGLIGFLCLCWVVQHYGGMAFRGVTTDRPRVGAGEDAAFAMSNLVALVAACVVNVFSSFQYNGVLITFVLLLALISRSESAEERAL